MKDLPRKKSKESLFACFPEFSSDDEQDVSQEILNFCNQNSDVMSNLSIKKNRGIARTQMEEFRSQVVEVLYQIAMIMRKNRDRRKQKPKDEEPAPAAGSAAPVPLLPSHPSLPAAAGAGLAASGLTQYTSMFPAAAATNPSTVTFPARLTTSGTIQQPAPQLNPSNYFADYPVWIYRGEMVIKSFPLRSFLGEGATRSPWTTELGIPQLRRTDLSFARCLDILRAQCGFHPTTEVLKGLIGVVTFTMERVELEDESRWLQALNDGFNGGMYPLYIEGRQ
ncbi:hypothetical protein P170DRAFT_479012 [Aspergillus steynii IBT 23096]|uniref:Uncharacterized protein n=1 Tax=Aspergillus steynii IBT 23096 TaxID=1392250 RepID=A0A2I2FZN9_9EURO|nr:uncharacterized protein P170DRAFT_479012 [Aspergillus steynii IBT 23096]PLB46093.1 hypothetical protein P170DRAFT_479012 [Aspergillus steynii IBT 23096]